MKTPGWRAAHACLPVGWCLIALVVAALGTCLAADQPAAPSETTDAKPTTEPAWSVPDEAAQRQALAGVHTAFAADYLKTNPTGQSALAQKMLALAIQTKDDPAARYMLLMESRRLATAAGDVPTALDAVEQIIGRFFVDRASLRSGTLDELSQKNGLKPSDIKLLCHVWYTAGAEAFAAEDYHALNRCIQRGNSVAGHSHDADLIADTQAKLRRWQQVIVAYELDKEALAILRQDPLDAKASTIVGRFYCFYRGEWERGLPLLAQCGDAALHDLARQDLQSRADSAAQVQMGDAWWDYSVKQDPGLAPWIKDRAIFWYEKALPSLSGITALRVKTRISQASRTKSIDLLAMLSEAKMQKNGWKKVAQGWAIEEDDRQLAFPYVPPTEYDYRIEFTSTADGPLVAQGLAFGERGFEWRMGDSGGAVCGINVINGKCDYEKENPTGSRNVPPLKAGQPHTSLVRIREKGITVLVDGKAALEFATDYANVGQKAADQGRLTFSIRATGTKTLIAAEVIEISGKGMVISESK